MSSTDQTGFTPPGPGQWALDRSHYPGGTTPISAWLIETSMEAGMARVFRELGTPAETVRTRFVRGFMYTRLRPLINPDKPATKLPPNAFLALATRVHPEFRRRAKAAQRALTADPWRPVLAAWTSTIRPQMVQANTTFASVRLDSLGNDDLIGHLRSLIEHCRRSFETHFWLHGYDLGPIARFLYETDKWGISASEAVAALAGASPTTARPKQALAALRTEVERVGARPSSLDDVRATSPAAAQMLDDYLAAHGDHIVTRYDLDGLTLRELPDVVLASIVNATSEPPPTAAAADALRSRVPASALSSFDQLLVDARSVMDLRDDNGPNTIEWPVGLLRHALLEVGRRLVAIGGAGRVEHALELLPDEVTSQLFDGDPSRAAELRRRARDRAEQALLDPPATLGAAELAPPVSVLPPVLRDTVSIVELAIRELGFSADAHARASGLRGVGVGVGVYRGTARCADSPETAIMSLEPGDVLVVRATNPAFNAVLALAGAVVTADGGPLSHAAVLARELGIVAVVGAPDAMTIPNGATVDVDPIVGEVRIVVPD